MGRKTPIRVLIGERRSAHRCCVAGCANVPRRDAIVCDIHARALGAVVEKGGGNAA